MGGKYPVYFRFNMRDVMRDVAARSHRHETLARDWLQQ